MEPARQNARGRCSRHGKDAEEHEMWHTWWARYGERPVFSGTKYEGGKGDAGVQTADA